MNYTWDDIILDNFINASRGQLEFVSKTGELNKETQTAWFAIQDSYIQTMDSETVEIKKYKKLCYKYVVKLREWLLNPKVGNRVDMEVNRLFMEKEALASQIFSDELTDWDLMIAKVSIGAQFRLNSKEMRAKEFFNIIKAL